MGYDEPGGLTEHSTVGSWIGALIACGMLIGGYFIARDYIQGGERTEIVEADAGSDAKTKKRKKKRRKRNRKRSADRATGKSFDDYDWEQDYADDDLVLGDIASERDEQPQYVEVAEPVAYEPTKKEWQPSGTYRATAKWSEPGANSGVIELDLSSPSKSSPLDEVQVKRVLNVKRLAPCYDRWVQKIPQMRGRVHMTFVVAGDGHVASVKITRSKLRSRVVEQCLVDRARGFRFPAAEGGAKTRFDTHFDFTNR